MLPPTTDATRLGRGYTIALLGAAVLSTTGISIRILSVNYQLPPLVLAFWRDLFVTVALLPALLFSGRRLLRVSRPQLGYLAWYGLALAGFNTVLTISVAKNGAAASTVLVYCSTAFTALLGHWLLRERLNGSKLLLVAVVLAGCALVSGAANATAWQSGWGGVFAGVLSGLGYAGYSLMGRSAAKRGLNPWTTLLYSFGFASLFLLLLNLLPAGLLPGTTSGLHGLFYLGDSLRGWLTLIFLAIGPTVFGFGLYNVSLTYLTASVANLLAATETVFTALFAYYLLGEQLNSQQLLGAVLILAGVVAMRLNEQRSVAVQLQQA